MAFLGLWLALILPREPAYAAPAQSLLASQGAGLSSAAYVLSGDLMMIVAMAAASAPPFPEQGNKPPPNVTLQAALAPGSAPLTEGISWRISKMGAGSGQNELVWSGAGAEPKVYLKPGRYYVEATYGLAQNSQTLEVMAEKAVASVLPLNAGTLLVNAVAVSGGAPLEDVFFTLHGTEGEGKTEVGSSSLTEAVFHVPAGDYRLTAKHGLASIDLPVSVTPGAESRMEAVMNTGLVALSAHAKENGPVMDGATFFVFKNGEVGIQQEVVRSKLQEPKFSLPAGHYRIASVLGMARIEKDITVAPGDDQKHDLVLNAGGVRLASGLAGKEGKLDTLLLYRVFSLASKDGAPHQEVFTSTVASPTVFLPSGRYRIESQYGWHNARQTREVDVGAGEVFDVNFEHKAFGVKLKLVKAPGADPIEPVKWTVKYNGGGTVLISQDAVPSLILQAGSYQAMAQHESKTYSQVFEASSDKEQTIELIAE